MSEAKAAPPAPAGGVLVLSLPGRGSNPQAAGRLYFDRNRNAGAVRDALAAWFALWGMPLDRTAAPTGFIETNTREIVWCDDTPEGLHGPQTVPFYAAHASRAIEALERLRPRLVIVLSAYLYEALGTAPVNAAVTSALGPAKGPARRISSLRLKALRQSFARAEMLVLPFPSKNTTQAFVRSLAQGVRQAFEDAGIPFARDDKPLRQKARSLFVLDEEATLALFERELGLKRDQAEKLLASFVGEALVKDTPLSKPRMR